MISVSGSSNPSQIGSCKLLTLKDYDILGQAEDVLVNEKQSAGWKGARWDGEHYPRGVYF